MNPPTQIGAAVKDPDGWHVAVVGPEMLYPAPHENVTTSPVTPVVLLTAPLSGAAVGEHARAEVRPRGKRGTVTTQEKMNHGQN